MTTNAHDSLFKRTFSQIEHAVGILRAVLPPSVTSQIDFSTLALAAGSFVDEALHSRHTDLLYTVVAKGKKVFLYVLFEHKSTEEALMPFTILRYMVRIWDAYEKDHPNTKYLPGIIPVVLHHSQTGWRAASSFQDLIQLDEEVMAAVRQYIPHFRFVLDDVSHVPDDVLHARSMTALGRLVLFCLKYARAPEELIGRLGPQMDLVREIRETQHGMVALNSVWQYILISIERFGPEQVVEQLLQVVDEDDKENVMTAGEQLIERGRVQGLLVGRRMLLKLLVARFGPLPEGVAEAVNTADPSQLELWAERVLAAPTLADVFATAAQ